MSSVALRLLVVLLTLSSSLVVGACDTAPESYGVVLWSRDSTLPPTGSIVAAGEVSEVSGLLPVSPLEEESEMFVEPGLVKRFDTLGKAKSFSERYDAYLDAFATAEVQALRVRAEPTTESEDLYRLRRGERVKLVGRVGKRQRINGATGHWQEVITSSGIRGYTFGPFLRLPTTAGDGDPAQQRSPAGDWRERLFSHRWRPAYMREMVRLERIDLRKFDPSIGLFPEKSSGTLLLNTGKSRLTFDAADSQPIGNDTYLFDGGQLQIRFLENGDLLVRYIHNGNAIQERYVLLEVEMEKAIDAERQRRAQLYDSILSHGQRYHSSAYGSLFFKESEQRVAWSDREILVPEAIPKIASETAQVRFDVFVSESIADRYDGALSLLFDMGSRQHELNVLYELLPSGMRWTLVSEESARDSVVQEAPRSSLVMFFSRVENEQRP